MLNQKEDILNFIRPYLKASSNSISLLPLKGDGSDRLFYRVTTGSTTFILINNPPTTSLKSRENLAFKNFSLHLLQKGLPVPQLIACDLSKGFFLMQDLGDTHLQTLVNTRKNANIWLNTVKILHVFHLKAREDFDDSFCLDGFSYDPPFVVEKELEYFRRVFLNKFLNINVPWNILKHDFFYLAEKAGIYETDWVIHRDFQSRNILVQNGKLYIIDYQGMRFGPVEYDVASFFIDPYVQVNMEWRHKYIKEYAKLNPQFDYDRFEALTLCRNLQILAAFAFLGFIKKKSFFLNYINEAMKRLCNNGLLKSDRNLKSLKKIVEEVCNSQKIMDRFTVS